MIKKLCLVALLFLSGCVSKDVSKPEVNSVYYEIFVGSFYDSDGDGMGDLKGVEMKLDYIQNTLGASGIWLMPIHPSRSYHKYDVMDYKDIDSDYGTMDDFEHLLDAMNDRGMDLILDFVVNHSSNEHPWFLQAGEEVKSGTCNVYCDYYHFSDEALPKYHKLSEGIYYESGFAQTMPDLNLDNPAVRDEILDSATFWLNKGIKGFRLDATTHFYDDNLEKNLEFLTWFNDEIKKIKSDAYIVGEAWTDSSIIQPMFASGTSFFNFSLAQNSGRLVRDINRAQGAHLAQSMATYQETIRSFHLDAIDSLFLSNHDQGRSASYFANNLEKTKLAASTYLLMPGNVFIYYGEEIGMIGSGRDENKRLPMVWGTDKGMTTGPKDADYEADQKSDVKTQMKDKESLLNHYREVIAIRNRYPKISRGKMKAIDLGSDGLFAIQMDDLMVVHNFDNKVQEFSGNYEILESSLGGVKTDEVIRLEPLSSVIIRVNE